MIDPATSISYAQNNEDVILKVILGDIKKGYYVDIGANHPTKHSVTKIFYDQGWRGINIEPNPKIFEQLKKARPREINLNVGVASEEGELSFRQYHTKDGIEGISTFSDLMKKENSQNTDKTKLKYQDINVAVTKLATILEKNPLPIIHFMKVDVEGLEYEVLNSNNWQKFRPHVICIESNHLLKDWHGLLKEAGYQLIYTDGLNEYFIASEVKESYKLQNITEKIINETSNVLKDRQFKAWKKDVNKIKNLENKNRKQQIAFDRAKSLTLKDQKLTRRAKRAVYGLTIDWLRYRKGKS